MVSLLEGTPTRLPGSPASVYLRRVCARCARPARRGRGV